MLTQIKNKICIFITFLYTFQYDDDEYTKIYILFYEVLFNFHFLSFENVLMNNFKVYFYYIKIHFSFTVKANHLFQFKTRSIIKIEK